MAVIRGCGTRVLGAVYAEIPLSKHGKPLEHFLVCPPQVVNASDLGISNIGVKLIEANGTWHIFDIIGKEHYPNVADFVEEARLFGISRRLPKNLDFKKLTLGSRLILLHDHAHIDNFLMYQKHETPCPKLRNGHDAHPLPEMCASLWWEDIVKGEPLEEDRQVVRKMPSFEYKGMSCPEGVKPEYKLAIFGSFPIPRLAVINDPKDKTHEESLNKAQKAGIPVRLCDE
jgi:hypothetical protein